jgi:MYXO-CTERM domain-containing protein
MMKRLVAPAIAALALSALAGTALAQADVRVVHASPDAPNVDVLVNNGLAFSNLPFASATTYASLPAGMYNFKVVPAGLPGPAVINADAMLSNNIDYTIAAVNTLSKIEPLILIDNNTLIGDKARVRFVHASPDAPAVDIALKGGGVLFGNVLFKGVGDYLAVGGGTYDFEVRLAGTSTVVLDVPGIALSNNAVYTVWAMGQVTPGGTPLQAVLTTDAIPSPGALALLGIAGAAVARRRR